MARQDYHYNPSLAAAVIFTVLFSLTTIFHCYQMVRTKTWFFIPFVIGGIFEMFGFAARSINAHETPNWSFGVFVIQSLGILLAPALFAASIYMGFGRIILLADGESLSIVKRTLLTKIFVSGDVLSFLFQATGGSIVAKQDPTTASKGKVLIEVGLWIQILFFGFFLVTLIIFWYRLQKSPTSCSKNTPWKTHQTTMLVAGGLILARSAYRVIEYIQGPEGNLMTHEVYTYVLDGGLMLIVMLIFHVIHPSEVGSLLNGGKAISLFRVYTPQKRDSGIPLTN